MNIEAKRKLLKDIEAAEELNLSRYTLRIWRSQGRGPEYVKLGRVVRYKPEALREYLETRSVRPGKE
jgi:predicted DNA-binding transcriptional regulator AlpA